MPRIPRQGSLSKWCHFLACARWDSGGHAELRPSGPSRVQGTDAATSKPGHVGHTCSHLFPRAQGLLCLPTWPTRSVGSVNGAGGAGESPAAEVFPWEAHCGQCPWLSLAYFPLQSARAEPRLLEVCSVNGAVAATVSALLLSVRLLMVQTGMRHGSCRHTSILSVCRECGCAWGGGQLRTSVPGVEGRQQWACGSPPANTSPCSAHTVLTSR